MEADKFNLKTLETFIELPNDIPKFLNFVSPDEDKYESVPDKCILSLTRGYPPVMDTLFKMVFFCSTGLFVKLEIFRMSFIPFL